MAKVDMAALNKMLAQAKEAGMLGQLELDPEMFATEKQSATFGHFQAEKEALDAEQQTLSGKYAALDKRITEANVSKDLRSKLGLTGLVKATRAKSSGKLSAEDTRDVYDAIVKLTKAGTKATATSIKAEIPKLSDGEFAKAKSYLADGKMIRQEGSNRGAHYLVGRVAYSDPT